MLSREDVATILDDPLEYEWQVQGFGMLRTYVKGEGEPRLQIWDQRLAVWGNGAIHDHPWDFTSTILAGTIFNQRFLRASGPQLSFGGWPERYEEVDIQPGPDGGKRGKPRQIWLVARPVEVLSAGEEYSQKAPELHVTRYLPGTVTYIERFDRQENDSAVSISKGRTPWQFFRPREATKDEIVKVTRDALRAWWL